MIELASGEPDYYATLGVSPDASSAEIEAAYRRLAARRTNATFRPGRAARELAQINAAYSVLGYPDRRADYDARRAAPRLPVAYEDPLLLEGPPPSGQARNRRQQLPRVTLGQSSRGSSAEALMILLVIALAVVVGQQLLSRPLVDLSFILEAAENLGVSGRRRAAVSTTPAAVAQPAAGALATAGPSPQPAATPLGAVPAGDAARYAGSEVRLSDASPARGSNLSVSLRLARGGQPVEGALVYLVAHFKNVDERWPAGNATVPTDRGGQATITFNIGDATVGHPVNVDLIALDGGQQVIWQTAFVPR